MHQFVDLMTLMTLHFVCWESAKLGCIAAVQRSGSVPVNEHIPSCQSITIGTVRWNRKDAS